MSHPIPSRDYGDNEFKSDSPHKEGGNPSSLYKSVKRLKGLQGTKHFGVKRRSRHASAKNRAIKKLRGEDIF